MSFVKDRVKIMKKQPKHECYHDKLIDYNKQKKIKKVEEPWYILDPEILVDKELNLENKLKEKPIPPTNPYGFGSTGSSRIVATEYSSLKSRSKSRSNTSINSTTTIDGNKNNNNILSQTLATNAKPYYASLLPKNSRAPENIAPGELKDMLMSDLHSRHRNVSDMQNEIKKLELQIIEKKLSNKNDKKLISTITKLLRSKQEELALQQKEMDILCSKGYQTLNKLRNENRIKENNHAVVCDRLQRRASGHWQSLHMYGVQRGPEDDAAKTAKSARKASIDESRRRKSIVSSNFNSNTISGKVSTNSTTISSTDLSTNDSGAYVEMMLEEEGAIARAMKVLDRIDRSEETRSEILKKLKEEFVPAVKEMVAAAGDGNDNDLDYSQFGGLNRELGQDLDSVRQHARRPSVLEQSVSKMISHSMHSDPLELSKTQQVVKIMRRRSVSMNTCDSGDGNAESSVTGSTLKNRSMNTVHPAETTVPDPGSVPGSVSVLVPEELYQEQEHSSNHEFYHTINDTTNTATVSTTASSNRIPFTYSVLQPPPPPPPRSLTGNAIDISSSNTRERTPDDERFDPDNYDIFTLPSSTTISHMPSNMPPPPIEPGVSQCNGYRNADSFHTIGITDATLNTNGVTNISFIPPEYQRRASLSLSTELPPPPKRRLSVLERACGKEDKEIEEVITTEDMSPSSSRYNSLEPDHVSISLSTANEVLYSPLQPPPPPPPDCMEMNRNIDLCTHTHQSSPNISSITLPSVYMEHIPSANPPPPVVPTADFTVLDESGAAVYVDALLPQRRASLSLFSSVPAPNPLRRGSVLAEARRMSYVPSMPDPLPLPEPVVDTMPDPLPLPEPVVTVEALKPVFSPLQPPPPPYFMMDDSSGAMAPQPPSPLLVQEQAGTSINTRSIPVPVLKPLPSSRAPPPPMGSLSPQVDAQSDTQGMVHLEELVGVDLSTALPQRRASLADSENLPAPPCRRPSVIEQARKIAISIPSAIITEPLLPEQVIIPVKEESSTAPVILSEPIVPKNMLSSLFGNVSPAESLHSEFEESESEVSNHDFSDDDY